MLSLYRTALDIYILKLYMYAFDVIYLISQSCEELYMSSNTPGKFPLEDELETIVQAPAPTPSPVPSQVYIYLNIIISMVTIKS